MAFTLFSVGREIYNGDMKSAESPALVAATPVDPALIGNACCMVAALIYAATNLCLRWLSVDCHPQWAVCVKETVSVAVVGPWLIYLAAKGVSVFPRGRALGILVLVGLITELGGNLSQLWAMKVIGLAVCIPLIVGSCLVSTAVLGRVWLGERVSYRSMVAIAMLIGAVAVLSLGASAAGASSAAAQGVVGDPLHMAWAVAAACLAGCCFSVLNVGARRSVTHTVRPAAVVVIITGVGTLSLAPLSWWQLGWKELAHTPPDALGMMLLAGLLNLIAFATYTTGLRFTTAVRANMMNATQTALAAAGGWLLFDEHLNRAVIVGILLTIAGITLIDRPVSDKALVAEM